MNDASAENGKDELRQLVTRILARRWWLVASVLLVTGALTAFAFLKTPVYRAKAVVIPASTTADGDMRSMLGQVSGLAALAGLNISTGDETKEEALAVLRSRHFTEAFINSEQLMPTLFAKSWDEKSGQWTSRKPPTMAKAYSYFDRKVRRIVEDKKTGLVTLEINWKDRNEAARWANTLVERLNTEMRSRAIGDANLSIKFLEAEYASTTVIGVREAVGRLLESQIKKRMFANVNRDYAFRVVDPAVAPDEDDPAAPNKLLLIAAGPVAGLAFGVMLILFADFWATLRPLAPPDRSGRPPGG